MTILLAERTIVDRISEEDAPFFVELVNTPGWLRFIGARQVSDVDDALKYLRNGFLRSYRDHGFSYYLVRRELDQKAMGVCGFLKKPELQNPDFGFAFLPQHVNQGYAHEACWAVLEYGVTTFGFEVLDAVTVPDNVRSIRLLEKLGFQREGTLKEASTKETLVLFRWSTATNQPPP